MSRVCLNLLPWRCCCLSPACASLDEVGVPCCCLAAVDDEACCLLLLLLVLEKSGLYWEGVMLPLARRSSSSLVCGSEGEAIIGLEELLSQEQFLTFAKFCRHLLPPLTLFLVHG